MAYDLIEMPEPYRTDWRFAFLCSMIASGLGRKTITPSQVYEEMRVYFDRLGTPDKAKDVDEESIKAFIGNIKK